jgi:hypothetical protein
MKNIAATLESFTVKNSVHGYGSATLVMLKSLIAQMKL